VIRQRKWACSVLQVALAVCFATGLAIAQDPGLAENGTSFQGRIRYENNAPAQNILVELWTEGEASFRTFATTDSAGKFHTGTPCTIIHYKVQDVGYLPFEGLVDASTYPCRTLVDITLRALPGTTLPGDEPPSGIVDARIAAIPDDAKKEFLAGQKAVNTNDFAGAIPHLQLAISLYPRYAEAYQLLGVAQVQTNQGPQAESSLIKAIEIEDRMPQAQYLLGALYAMTDRANLAEKPLQRFAELDPKNPDAHFELAKVSFALNKFADAETHAREAIELKETNAGVHIVLGYALLRQKDADGAKQAFQQFLKLDPNSPMATEMKNAIAQIDQRTKK
jgi:Flp pilus assembly protein TadD